MWVVDLQNPDYRLQTTVKMLTWLLVTVVWVLMSVFCVIIKSLMTSKTKIFITSTQSLIGAIIGVGIFGLPYIFSQAGYPIGLAHLLVVGAVALILVLAYAEIVLHANGHHRLSGNVEQHLGRFWGSITSIALFASNWGAMLAYIILGGEFLHALTAWLFGGSTLLYQFVFFAICAAVLIGGLGFVSRTESIFVFALLALLVIIIGGSAPYVDVSNLLVIEPALAFAPFGVVFFAFGGIATVPEMKAILGRYKKSLKRSIIVGFAVITTVYVLFTAAVVSVSGGDTTEEAILGLGSYIGDWAVLIGSLIGLFAVFTSFLILGVQVMDTAIYDHKAKYMTGWAWAITAPFILFIAGARDFIGVIGFTGGVFGVVIGLLVISMYKKAKRSAQIAKRGLTIPNWLLNIMALVLILGMITTVVSVFQ
jgi:tyrosine-specific transport protein